MDWSAAGTRMSGRPEHRQLGNIEFPKSFQDTLSDKVTPLEHLEDNTFRNRQT